MKTVTAHCTALLMVVVATASPAPAQIKWSPPKAIGSWGGVTFFCSVEQQPLEELHQNASIKYRNGNSYAVAVRFVAMFTSDLGTSWRSNGTVGTGRLSPNGETEVISMPFVADYAVGNNRPVLVRTCGVSEVQVAPADPAAGWDPSTYYSPWNSPAGSRVGPGMEVLAPAAPGNGEPLTQTLRLEFGRNYATFELNGRRLTGHEHFDNEYVTQDSNFSADTSALDLENVLSDPTQAGYFVFFCKNRSRCLSYTMTCEYKDLTFPRNSCPGTSTSDQTNGFDYCTQTHLQGCVSFLKAVRGAGNSDHPSTPAPGPVR
jgi:hypothetical protein